MHLADRKGCRAAAALWRPVISSVLVVTTAGGTLLQGAGAGRLMPGQLASERKPEMTQPGTPDTGAATESNIHIRAVQGDHAVNILKQKVTVRPVVEVLDAQDRPVKGALVTFTTPTDGASVAFGNGLRTTTGVTDSSGKASPGEITAVNTGAFHYQVRAMYQEQLAMANVAQTNVATADQAAAANTQSSTSAPATVDKPHRFPAWAIAALVGGAAAGAGIGIAAGSRSSSKTTATPPTAVIGTGSGATVGAP